MPVFSTKIPLAKETTKKDILNLCRRWIGESKHYQFGKIVFDPESEDDYTLNEENGHSTICIRTYRDDKKDIMIFRLINPQPREMWINDCIFCDDGKKKTVIVLLDRKQTGFAIEDHWQPKKPYLVKLLVKSGLCSIDAGMEISEKVLEGDVNICSAIMTGTHNNTLPVVYVSLDSESLTLINCDYLAKRLSGVAHVIKERDPNASRELNEKTNKNNPFDGYVGVFFPGSPYCRKFGSEFYDSVKDMEHDIFDYVNGTLNNEANFYQYTFERVLGMKQRKKLREALKRENLASNDLNEFMDSFDGEFENLNSQISNLQMKNEELSGKNEELFRQNSSLDAQLQSYKQYVESTKNQKKSVLVSGDENEFYPGEASDLLLSILSQVKNNYPDDSHAYMLIDSILSANKNTEINKQMLESLRTIMYSGQDLNKSSKADLRRLGFTITEDGTHYKLRYKDDNRFQFSMSKTSSDIRAFKNLFSELSSRLSLEKKLK